MTVPKQDRNSNSEEKVLPESLGAFSDLVAQFYDAPLRQDPSWEGSLEAVRTFFGANYTVSIFRPPSPNGRNMNTYNSYSHITYSGVQNFPDIDKFYNENFYAIDLFVNLPLNKAYTVQDFLDENEWQDNAFYKQFLAPMDVFHVLGIDICTAKNGGCQIRICRPKDAPAFTKADKEYLELMVVHMQRCVELHARRYEAQATTKLFSSVFDRLMFGSVILDQYGFVLNTNNIAEEIIRTKTACPSRAASSTP